VGETSTAWQRPGGPGGRTENTPPSSPPRGAAQTSGQVSAQPVTRAAEAPHPALPRSEKPGPFLSPPRPRNGHCGFPVLCRLCLRRRHGTGCQGTSYLPEAIRLRSPKGDQWRGELPDSCHGRARAAHQGRTWYAPDFHSPVPWDHRAAMPLVFPAQLWDEIRRTVLTNHLFLFEYMKRQ
jgi:hypothetical protein